MTSKVYPEGTKRGRESRITRGIRLYADHHDEIADIGDGFYLVPSSEPGRSYLVDLENEVCDCKDFEIRGLPCKHCYCATIAQAKGGEQLRSPSPRVCRRSA